MKRNTTVSLLITILALGMQFAGAADTNAVDKDVVSAVEVALDKAGYYVGKTNGDFTADTRTAVISFQKEHSLPVTGTITPEVLKVLGLQ